MKQREQKPVSTTGFVAALIVIAIVTVLSQRPQAGGSLSSITANIGTVTAGTMSGVSAVFGSGAVTLDSSGLAIAQGTSSQNKISFPGAGTIHGTGNDILITSGDSVALIAPGVSSITVGAGYITLDPSPSGQINTHFIGGGNQTLCVNNSGVLYATPFTC